MVEPADDPRFATRACELFGVKYPIVQTGMGWVSYPKLTAATSAAGGLGIIAAAPMTFLEMQHAVREVQETTENPFGVNLRTDAPDIDHRIEWLIAAGVKIVSFAQAPGEAMVKKLKDNGIVTMPTIGAKRHAEKVAGWGVDAVIAQGAEGGGHTGVVPTGILALQVLEAVDIPVIVAGGITDGRGLAGALAWGADGVAMGTRFLLAAESQVPDHVKQIYFDTQVNATVVTTAIDGAPQRVIRTEMIDKMEKARLSAFPKAALNALKFRKLTGTPMRDLLKEGLAMKKNQDLTWAQLALAANAPMLTKATMVDGHPEVGIMPTGMGLGMIDRAQPVAEIIDTMLRDAQRCMDRLCP